MEKKLLQLFCLGIALFSPFISVAQSPMLTDKPAVPSVEAATDPAEKQKIPAKVLDKEVNFTNMVQLTNGGDNAEAYWSFDSKKLVFQSNNSAWGVGCDQIFVLPTVTEQQEEVPMVSTGKGRTTCAYFMPGDKTVIYASTHLAGDSCPPPPAPRKDRKYVWPIDSGYDIFVADMTGKIVKQLTNTPGYDAEATVSPKGDKIVFTSMRSGDLELYIMDINGKNVKQITNTLGYDGGAFFSPDGKKLIFRASRPKTPEAIKEYKDLLKDGLVAPTEMELFVVDVDGKNLRQITNLGKANWAPYFHPDGKRIIFSSNHHTERGFPFNLFMIGLDGKGLRQVSFDPTFDSFPMFSPNGKKLSFSSNRDNGGTRDTNVFVVDWVD